MMMCVQCMQTLQHHVKFDSHAKIDLDECALLVSAIYSSQKGIETHFYTVLELCRSKIKSTLESKVSKEHIVILKSISTIWLVKAQVLHSYIISVAFSCSHLSTCGYPKARTGFAITASKLYTQR